MTRTNGFDDDTPIDRTLPCKLTEAELLARGDSMADAELAIVALKMDRKLLNGRISEQVDLRNRLAMAIDSGEESRAVMCKWIAHYAANCFSLVRQDTGEEVEVRPMVAADRQLGLVIDAEVPAPASGHKFYPRVPDASELTPEALDGKPPTKPRPSAKKGARAPLRQV